MAPYFILLAIWVCKKNQCTNTMFQCFNIQALFVGRVTKKKSEKKSGGQLQVRGVTLHPLDKKNKTKKESFFLFAAKRAICTMAP